MFLELLPLVTLLLLTLLTLLAVLTITSLLLPKKQSTLINIILIILKTNVQIHFLTILLNDETANIISSLDKNQSVGPCSAPYKILILKK